MMHILFVMAICICLFAAIFFILAALCAAPSGKQTLAAYRVRHPKSKKSLWTKIQTTLAVWIENLPIKKYTAKIEPILRYDKAQRSAEMYLANMSIKMLSLVCIGLVAGVIFIPKLMNQPKEEPQIEVTEETGNAPMAIDSVKTQEDESVVLEGTEQEDVKTSAQETAEEPVKPTSPQIKDGYGTVNLGYGVYTGDLKNGKPHGHGRIKYSQRHKIVNSKDFVANPGDEFEGDFRDGRVSGGIGYWYHDGNQTAIKP